MSNARSAVRLDFPWTLGIAVLAIVATVMAQHGRWTELVATHDGVWQGQLWRLVTGSLVHSNFGHLARDVIAFVLLGASYEPTLGKRWLPLLLPSLIIPVAVSLVLQPLMPAYFGLSGAVYSLIAAAFLVEWQETAGHPPRWIVGFSAVTLLKLVYETATGQLLIPMELGAGIVPVPIAHIVGLVVGVAVVWSRRLRPLDASQTLCL